MKRQRRCSHCEKKLPDFLNHPSCYCKPCRAFLAKGWRAKAKEPNAPEKKPRYDFGPLGLVMGKHLPA